MKISAQPTCPHHNGDPAGRGDRQGMKHFLLIYELAPDYLDRRPAFRDAHLALAQEAVARGELVLGGALDPADRAVLLFEGEDATAAERFAQADPYVAGGLVIRWSVHGWTTVVGKMAATSVQPPR